MTFTIPDILCYANYTRIEIERNGLSGRRNVKNHALRSSRAVSAVGTVWHGWFWDNLRKNLSGVQMSLLWQILPFFLVTWLLILLIPVRINLSFFRENRDDFLTVRVDTFFSLLRFSLEVPVFRQKDLDLELEAELKTGAGQLLREEEKQVSVIDILEHSRRIINYVLCHKRQFRFMFRLMARVMTVEKLSLHVAGGFRDAALTGVLAGLYWTLTGTLAAIAGRWLKLRCRPRFSLTPDFGVQPEVLIRADTTVSLYIGQLLLLAMILFNIKVR